MQMFVIQKITSKRNVHRTELSEVQKLLHDSMLQSRAVMMAVSHME